MEKAWLIVPGLLLLIGGGEWLVRGASRLASLLGVPPVVIGLSVVAFGTSAPELAVSILAAYRGQPDIAVGNVVGSNIVNILLILGLSAVVAPLAVSVRLIKIEVPLMIGTALLFFVLGYDGKLTRADGLLLVGIFIAYLVWMTRTARSEPILEEELEEVGAIPRNGWTYFKLIGLIIVGLVGLVLGSEWLIQGAVAAARAIGVSELVIGLTVVAVGTSLPELATSVIASMRGERDISVGNVVGSNIFNILSVLGFSSLVAPDGLTVAPAVTRFDALVMIGVSLACFPVFFNGFEIKRWEGALFVGYYIAYTVYLILNSSRHDALDEYTFAMQYFVIPLTVIALILTLVFAWNRQYLKPRRFSRKAVRHSKAD
ncbi:MAG: sodium:calcium antiporter [Armatimonadetes bacterium JP3_11]|nr:MAG: sodium:calcium antiporter [Armatimonadetes bacterium JP3_11]RMH10710.1 MAG: sodium:calcium antiporter [Armatimonadota bacterium]